MRTGLSFNGAMMTWRKIKNYWYTVLYKAMDLIWKMYEELYFINSLSLKDLLVLSCLSELISYYFFLKSLTFES